MKNTLKVTTALFLISSAGSLYASGTHSSEGHDDNMNKMKMKMGADHDMSKMNAHWASPKEALNRVNPITSSQKSIKMGASIYQKNCASCHGVNAMGDGPASAYLTPKPSNLVAMSGSHPDGDFAWKIENGRGPMPAWKGVLSESDIWNTVNFIQSLKGKPKASGGHGHGGGAHN